MALTSELTMVHMEALTAIGRIERNLRTLHRDDPEQSRAVRISDQLARSSVRLRQSLARFFEREQTELFPRVRRICGNDLQELQQLAESQHQVLNRLDQFIATVSEDAESERPQSTEYLHDLEQHFARFVDDFEQRCALERSFYRSYSTILFPGGVATD